MGESRPETDCLHELQAWASRMYVRVESQDPGGQDMLSPWMPQHPDEHRPKDPVLPAVDQQLGKGASLRVCPVRLDPVGSLEVGEREDAVSVRRDR